MAGNKSLLSTKAKFNVDSTADVGNDLALSLPDTLINLDEQTAIRFNVLGLDADATARVSFSDGSNQVESTSRLVDLSAFTDGTITLTVVATDKAGNTATVPAAATLTLDTTALVISGITPNWGSVLNSTEDDSNGTVMVTTSGAEDNQTVTVTLNGNSYTGTVASNSATVTVPAADLEALTDGSSYTMTADVADAAGNAATQVTSSAFTVDTTAPVIFGITPNWGSVLNSTEDDSNGTVTVTTSGQRIIRPSRLR